MTAYLHSLVDFIALHPHWAGLVAFAAALAECVVVVGAIIPGASVIVALAALIGYGGVSLWPLLAWTVAGAMVGDNIGYWLGRTYDGRIRGMWPFATRPGLIDKGEAFFHRYGGWSVVIGRFLPPTRAIVPVVAGLLGMGRTRFFVANAVSALLWAAAHIATGMLAGYTLIGLGAVSRRLVVAILILAIGLVVVVWLVRLAAGLGLRVLPHGKAAMLAWARGRHGRMAALVVRALAPEHDDFRLFVVLSAILIAAFVGFAGLLEEVVSKETIVSFDHAVSQFMQTLRTGWTDRVMLVPTVLGDWAVTTAVAVAGCAVLAFYRCYRLAGGVAVALVSTMAFVQVMKRLVHASRPVDLYAGADSFSFPSGHATMTATLYGLIGVIAFRGLGGAAGRAAMAVCASFIATVAISRVYLGAHWPSDVVAGVLFGTGMTAGFALVFHRDAPSRQTAVTFLAACMAALVLIGTWHIERDYAKGLAFYARQPLAPVVLARAWRDGGWRDLPAYRIDVGGEREEPLMLQWRGTAAALVEDLSRLGWSAPPPWSLATINRFAYPGQDATALPVTPKFHDGGREVVAMMRPAALGSIQGRYVLRAWPRQVEEPGGKVDDVLLASIAFERIAHPMNEMSIPVAVDDVPCDAGPLLAGLAGAFATGQMRKASDGGCSARPVLAGG